MSKVQASAGVTRRRVLRGLATGLVVGPLMACTDDGGSGSGDDTGSDGTLGSDDIGSGDTGDSGSSTGDTTSDSTSDTGTTSDDPTGEGCGEADSWATGGTAAMTAKDCYPDPFAAGVAACALLCQTTAGPCTADTIERQDVSEGWPGLPVRLALKFVYAENCEPVEGAMVEIWHTQRTGVYSGVTPSGAFCYGNDPDAENHLYFRGSQTTDAAGRIDFDTCYPGWYSGRAIHIHFRVYLQGNLYLTSQLFFTEELTQDICSSHPDYLEFGQPDTVNSTDNVVGGEDDLTPYILDVARMADGAMLASKVVAIRSSTGESLCTAQGSGGMGGTGGPPP
ncbi:MAG: protocatechuate 3,4-dioxygenase [Myxococcales bacterium]|nr:protocatechuate 3,4-dioxygenase [Myxococcales bacterium]